MPDITRAVVHSGILSGLEAVPIEVIATVHAQAGRRPSFVIEGVDRQRADELASLVRCALRSCGYEVPRGDVVISLEPRSVYKTTYSLGLAVALAVLRASHQVPPTLTADRLLVGELTMQGTILPPRGALAYEALARTSGLKLVTAVAGYHVGGYDRPAPDGLGMASLEEARSGRLHPIVPSSPKAIDAPRDVQGYGGLKLAVMVSALTGLNVALRGHADEVTPAWVASAVRHVMPDPSAEALAKLRLIASVTNCADLDGRPLRAPHHSISLPGMLGGGRPILPGEVTLAHNGVLFLDEVAKFSPAVLRGLQAANDSWHVDLARADGTVTMPAACTIVMYDDGSTRHVGQLAQVIDDLTDIDLDLAGSEVRDLFPEADGLTCDDMRSIVARERESDVTRDWVPGLSSCVDGCPQEKAEALLQMTDAIAAVRGSDVMTVDDFRIATALVGVEAPVLARDAYATER